MDYYHDPAMAEMLRGYAISFSDKLVADSQELTERSRTSTWAGERV
jgi:hypothetical protein